MKIKTSVTLSASTLGAIDEVAGDSNRSRVIEQAVLEYVGRRRRAIREARDLDILDRAAESLNRETEEILAFQAEP